MQPYREVSSTDSAPSPAGPVVVRPELGTREACLALDARAPRAARSQVDGLRGRIPASTLQDARLVVSEFVTNSVSHRGARVGAVATVRLPLGGARLRVEVEDPGGGGAISPRSPDLDGGFGLNLVERLREGRGLERMAAGGTRVWAQLGFAGVSGSGAVGDRLEIDGRAAGARPSAGGGPREDGDD